MGNAIKCDGFSSNGPAWWRALPFNLKDLKVTLAERPTGFRFSQFIYNIEARLNEKVIIACGESASPDLAMTRAVAELVERSAMLSFSRITANGYQTSSGWAAHENEQLCKQGAALELIERDAVLAQWYTSTPFIEIDPNGFPNALKIWKSADLANSEFPQLRILLSTEGLGPSVSCLLTNAEGFGVSGHATKLTLYDSIESALAEACRAAHLAIRRSFWNESIELKYKAPESIDPATHGVFYAYHEPFPNWMFGPRTIWDFAEHYWRRRISEINFDEFRVEVVLNEPFVVGFATHPEVLEVKWGSTNESDIRCKIMERQFSNLSKVEKLNLKPHIVS